jgi:hypothetical protein
LTQVVSKDFPLDGIKLPESCPTTLKGRSDTGPLALRSIPPEPLIVTPTVYQVAKGLFRRPLQAAGQDSALVLEPGPPQAEPPRFSKVARRRFAEYEKLNRVYENSMEVTKPDNTHIWKVRRYSHVTVTAGHLSQIGDTVSVRLKRSFQEHEAIRTLHLEVKGRNEKKPWNEYNKLADDWW